MALSGGPKHVARCKHCTVSQQTCDCAWRVVIQFTKWFKYDRDWLCVNKSQFVPVIFEPPCISTEHHDIRQKELPRKLSLQLSSNTHYAVITNIKSLGLRIHFLSPLLHPDRLWNYFFEGQSDRSLRFTTPPPVLRVYNRWGFTSPPPPNFAITSS
jgi:hypothetical protein